MADNFVLLSATLILATALVHSAVGERKLISPLLAMRPEGILKRDLARFLIRFAWHLTSLTWVALAAILISFVLKKGEAFHCALFAVGISFTASGIYDAFASKGKHIGWPLLTAIGVCAIAAIVLGA